jgi:hypothetical protein
MGGITSTVATPSSPPTWKDQKRILNFRRVQIAKDLCQAVVTVGEVPGEEDDDES